MKEYLTRYLHFYLIFIIITNYSKLLTYNQPSCSNDDLLKVLNIRGYR